MLEAQFFLWCLLHYIGLILPFSNESVTCGIAPKRKQSQTYQTPISCVFIIHLIDSIYGFNQVKN